MSSRSKSKLGQARALLLIAFITSYLVAESSPRARDAHLREIHVHEQKRIPGSPDRRRDIAFGVRFKLPEPVREGYSFIDP
eukprot:jgi/Tetstr1/430632/TSEL_020425.t1